MQLKDIIEYKIYTAPDGFGVSEVEKWLKDIPAISSFDEIEPFFGNNDFSFNEWFALIVIIRNKYINPVTINNDFSSNYEMRANTALSSQQYLDLNLKEDKSGVLDFSAQKNLRRLILTSCRICESIILPENSNLELIEILNMPKLKHIKNLDSLKSLKSLALNKCNKFEDYSIISSLTQLLMLSLSSNKSFNQLKFLIGVDNLKILNLIDTNAIKIDSTLGYLSQLENLKVLNIKANQAELKKFRKALPDCFVNGSLN